MIRSPPPTPSRKWDTKEMTDEELYEEYMQLREANAALVKEEADLQLQITIHGEESVRFQQNTEIEEDKLANQLLRRLKNENREKCRYRELIRQEENSRQEIMEQISQVRSQKTEVETQLDWEQESLMRQLQRKLVEVVNRKSDVERELLRERQRYLDVLATQLAHLKQGSVPAARDEGLGGASAADAAQILPGAAEAPQLQAEPKATGRMAGAALSDVPRLGAAVKTTAEVNSANSTIIDLEKRLNHMLRKHAEAMHNADKNEETCAELRKQLESIQQAAFLDRARASKLKEELAQAKIRLEGIEQRCRPNSTLSDDSYSLSTPTICSLKNMSLLDRTKEALSAPLQRMHSSHHPSCDTSEINDDTRSFTSSTMRSPAAGVAPRSAECDGAPYMKLETQQSSSAATPKGAR